MRLSNSNLYSAFWPNTALRTTRLSATGPRTIATLIASSDGGAGSARRVYKFLQHYQNISARDYVLAGIERSGAENKQKTIDFYSLFLNNRSY